MKRFVVFFLCIMLWFCSINGANADPHRPHPHHTPNAALPMDALARLPILHEGRVKPIDSFARAMKKSLSGTDTDALRWLQTILFDPARAEEMPIIKITNPDVLNQLDIKRRPHKLYSYETLLHALETQEETLKTLAATPEKDWTKTQRALADVQDKMVNLRDMMASLSAFLPLAAHIPPSDQIDISALPASLQEYAGQRLSYFKASEIGPDLQAYVRQLTRAQGSAIEGYSPLQQAMVHLAFSIDSLRLGGQASTLWRIIPAPHKVSESSNGAPFLTPWETLSHPILSARERSSLTLWQDLTLAYHAQDPQSWMQASYALLETIPDTAPTRPRALKLEYQITQLSPLHNTALLYGLALILLSAASLWQHLSPQHSVQIIGFINAGAFAATLCGVLLHSATLAARIYILQRPPVSTLFESVLFVGALSVSGALILHLISKRHLWLWCAAFLGLFLQILAISHDQDGDSMMMLSAVLNTNFWLATHVICITTGYGFCILTSALAHYQLGKAALTKMPIKQQDDTQKMLHTLALLSLLFAAVGTILGGVWADQSWGRFWGWDPKENGALLIVLWLIWILHGRISGHMNAPLYTAGLAGLSIITALSWFGVNLLNVGLHSYGFTHGLAQALFIFIALETAAIAALWFYGRKPS